MNATVKFWIESGYGVEEANATFESNKPKPPTKPNMPKLGSTSTEFAKYAKDLQVWESDMEVHQNVKHNYHVTKSEHEANMKEFILESNSVRTFVTNEKQVEKLWSKAWEHGHGGGWNSINYWVSDLVELFTA